MADTASAAPAADALSQRVRITQIARQLQQRLALAAYKAEHGLQSVPAAPQPPAAMPPARGVPAITMTSITLPPDLGPPLPAPGPTRSLFAGSPLAPPIARLPRARMPSDPGPLYPAELSLYDSLLSPSLDSLPGRAAFSPMLDSDADGFARPSKRQRGNTAPGLRFGKTIDVAATRSPPGQVVRRALGSPSMGPPPVPANGMRHRRLASMPSPIITRPLSTSDPSFASSVPDLLGAAAALTSFSKSPSSPSMPAPASPHSPHLSAGIRRGSLPPTAMRASASPKLVHRARTVTPPHESAEELLLFLAASPSPSSARRFTPGPHGDGSDDARSVSDVESSRSPRGVKRGAPGLDAGAKIGPSPLAPATGASAQPTVSASASVVSRTP